MNTIIDKLCDADRATVTETEAGHSMREHYTLADVMAMAVQETRIKSA